MSDPRGQPEPSMEEILASIRKIISEESEGEGASAEADSETEAPLRPIEDVAPPRPAAPPPRSPAGADPDVLLLTEMVNDDGSVVSLASARAATPPAAPERVAAPEPLAAAASSVLTPTPEPLPDEEPPRHEPPPDRPPVEPPLWLMQGLEPMREVKPVADEPRSAGLASDKT